MSRVAQVFSKTKITSMVLPLIIIVGGIVAAEVSHNAAQKPQIAVQASQTTDVKYHGVTGQTALALLKKYENVQVKHYSFGDEVTAINGSAGNGPKYWSFYVNNKLADVGAGTYVTKSTDQIEWKLQKL